MDQLARDGHNRYQRWYYESTFKRTMQPAATPYVLRQVERVVAAAGLEPGQRILEVGCGLGRYTMPLLQRGLSLTAIDLSPVMLEKLASRAAGLPLRVIACDVADAARHLDDRFDRAVGFFVLHHLHDLEVSFSGLARVLAPGAVVAFLEPVWWNPLYYLQTLLTPRMTLRGEKGLVDMRRARLERAIAATGLGRLRATSFGYLPPFAMNSPLGARIEAALAALPLVRRFHAFQVFTAVMG